MVWSLALHGWRYWNRSAQLSGNSAGARIRRWWYGVNNWTIEAKESLKKVGKDAELAAEMGDVGALYFLW